LSALEIAEVIQSKALIPIVVILAMGVPTVIKGLFALNAGRNQRRKEFLEFWKEKDLRNDDLWLEESFALRYGGAMPARMIRHLLRLDWPSQKLRRVAMNADFFEVDEARRSIVWKRRWRGTGHWLKLEQAASGLAYFVFSSGAGILFLGDARHDVAMDWGLLVPGVTLAVLASMAFWHLVTLVDARSALNMLKASIR